MGLTSVAAIEPLVSLASMIEAVSTGTATVRSGRAAATISTASATANASIGTCRRQRGRRGVTDALSAGAANAAAALVRRRCWRDVPADQQGDREQRDQDGGVDEAHGYPAGRVAEGDA